MYFKIRCEFLVRFCQESPHYRTSQHRIRCDVNWIHLAHDRGKWQARVNTVMKCVEFLCCIRNCQLLKNCSMKLVVNWFNTITRRYIIYASLNKINIIPTNVTNGNCLSCPLRSDTLVLRHYPHHRQTETFK
jgi:hypothetical protein